MLLGIALHAALAYEFAGTDWPVLDSEKSPLLDELVAFTHGFRMPLFFVLGGFFAAMLWEKRGLRGLLNHRSKRILLPLGIGCLTIVPAVWIVAIVGDTGSPTYGVPESHHNLWTAAAEGDLAQVKKFAESGWPVDEPDPFFLQTPMAWAVYYDRPEVVAELIRSGADPNARFGGGDRSTLLHGAAFFGRAECARLLLEAGADTEALNEYGETPRASMQHGQEVVSSIAQALSIKVDFERVQAGRAEVEAMLDARAGAGGSDGPGPASEPGAGEREESRSPGVPWRAILMGFMHFPFFHHLWFLWILIWLTAGLAVAGSLLAALRAKPKLPWWLVASPLALVWLVPLTALAQSAMFSGIFIPAFGPDTSAGLLPIPHVLGYYAIFFGFGALVYVIPGAGSRLGTGWWALLPLAVAMYPAASAISRMTPWGYELAGDELTRRTLSAAGQALFCWLVIFGTIGACRKFLSARRPWLRYLSDSSYWLYLAHLPLVILGHRLLLPLPLPGLAKFSILLVACTAILLASYEWGVRYTFIGAWLNGRRTRPAS